MAQLQRDRAVRVGGDEGDLAVEEDEAFDDLVEGACLRRAAHQLHVVQQALAVPGHMRVQVAHPDAAATHLQRAVQALGEFVLAADAARLHRQDLARALLRRLVHRGANPGQSVEDPDRHPPAGTWTRPPSPAYHSKADTASPTRAWLALTSSYTPRSSRVMTSCGEVGTSHPMSSGSGCSSASSSRQGTASASSRGTRPRRTARE